MQVGDRLRLTPTFDSTLGFGPDYGPRPCTVVYVHPEERFFVAEFASDLGIRWRETFYLNARSGEREKGR